MREHKDPGTIGGIGVVVLTYEANTALLERCLGSIVAAWQSQPAGEPQTALIDVVVADNDSPSLRAKTKALTERLAAQSGAPLRFVPLARNFGFAGGNNRGVEFLDTRISMVFLLNPDAEVESDAIRRCGEALLNAPLSTVSAAPKMLLSRSTVGDADAEFVIDAVANAINAKGEAFNIGLGQPDLGHPALCRCHRANRRSANDRSIVHEHLVRTLRFIVIASPAFKCGNGTRAVISINQ